MCRFFIFGSGSALISTWAEESGGGGLVMVEPTPQRPSSEVFHFSTGLATAGVSDPGGGFLSLRLDVPGGSRIGASKGRSKTSP